MNTVLTDWVKQKGWKQTDYKTLLSCINQKEKAALKDLERDGETKL
jgi:hypothetical protein